MIPRVTVPKKAPRSFVFIIFRKIIASGKLSPTVAIIMAMAVPMGTPLVTSDSMTGMAAEAFKYKGTAKIVASGTVHHLSRRSFSAKKFWGIQPCISAPSPTPTRTHTYRELKILFPSRWAMAHASLRVGFFQLA